MLIINKDDKVHLLKKYHDINNICAYIYDQLAEILAGPYYSEMSKTQIDFSNDEDLKKSILDNKTSILDALSLAKKDKDVETVVIKHITMSILSDMVDFIYESLNNAKKGKMSIAFALLRKPFTDQLLIFEQILNNKSEFLNRFYYNGNPNEYDPSSKALNKEAKEAIIDSAIKKLNYVHIFEAEFIYQIRYDKNYNSGINWISNQALHIVTGDPAYVTENKTFNFTLQTPEFIEKCWEHYYLAVPILLLYTVSIVDEIIFQFISDNKNQKGNEIFKKIDCC